MQELFFDKNLSFKLEVCCLDADPDSCSELLQKYHQLLWSKRLPNGNKFDLTRKGRRGSYKLYYDSMDMELSSDRMNPSFVRQNVSHTNGLEYYPKRRLNYLNEVDYKTKENFYLLSWTIGGSIIFPSKRKDRMTINGARGFNNKICDRFDLTLECIKRYYSKRSSPLYEILKTYKEFFDLFQCFEEYCKFFLLDDLVDNSHENVKFFLGFKEFGQHILPANINEYIEYKNNVELFINRRATRMLKYLDIANPA
ncbi:MAG: hypothetical protein LBV08_03365 [Clostridiales bacterium]|jgi:hypothetical protein|nr:hypothetical protein [Clostridiales bacterium]